KRAPPIRTGGAFFIHTRSFRFILGPGRAMAADLRPTIVENLLGKLPKRRMKRLQTVVFSLF
ncbi:hypothetical protein, partial [Pseudomonas sp. BIOMIG1BD]|uniref:hypothetical protein n=1 Tax=Pseudomonas sp. BIOMIG1BD TaxID=1758731 RepID=UPI0019D37027